MFQKFWLPEMTVQHILEREGREPLNSHYYATHYPSVHAAAVRIWGSWKNAILACGLDYDAVRKYKTWSRERVLREIVEQNKIHSPLSSKYIQTVHKPLYMAAIKRFGSWGEALRQAGIDYRRIRLRQLMKPEEIKGEILKLYRSGISLSYPYMREHHQNILAAGMKKLGDGSWHRARLACGISTNYRALGQAHARRQPRNVRKAFENSPSLPLEWEEKAGE